jgi:site-specific DNA recombinase
MSTPAAFYARVSSDRQKEQHTIGSQVTALIQYAETHGYLVPPEWQFQDDGYSGATLVRPGLEAIRDLAVQGQIEAVLVHSPDRLSRKYAYQVLLTEELARCGVQLVFVHGPSGTTPEDALLAQFQGMIAEYERAQILERSRRGKRHRAQHGTISVLSGAPYGYRYVKKSDTAAAYYDIVEAEAEVVRLMFESYIRQGLSINAIARRLNEREIPTRTGTTRWERSTVWGMLRNPAYSGHACFGKTEVRPRQRITRPLRQRGGISTRNSANHERPRQEWIEIPVPALVSESTFARAQEQLEQNKRHSPRRTIEPTLLQGMLVCERCGYALYRTSTQTSRRRLYYYRCLGTDRYRHLKGAACDTRPVRQDHLDTVVWNEVLRLLDDPGLIQAELDRRHDVAQRTDPLKHREDALRRDEVRFATNIDRLVTAYQDGLLTLDQLRGRVPELQKRQHGVQAELRSLAAAATDETHYLRLIETLADFRTRLRGRAETLEIAERQKILRLVVKEIVVGHDTITIRHSIPVPDAGPESSGGPRQPPDPSRPRSGPGYLLRSGSHDTALRRALRPFLPCTVPPLHRCSKPPRDIQPDPRIVGVARDCPLDQVMGDGIKGTYDTLPISRTCPSGSRSFVNNIRSKVDR